MINLVNAYYIVLSFYVIEKCQLKKHKTAQQKFLDTIKLSKR